MVLPRTNYSTKTAEAIRSKQAPGSKFPETEPTRLAGSDTAEGPQIMWVSRNKTKGENP